ncbi:MAG TPA: alpha-xylosidase [Phototrophicaceae bacterium]|nr:alpha-xylosidase [Phototrophicaceae bacterium]
MRFEQGYWRLLPGTQAIYPLTVVDVQVERDALVVTGYDHVIRARWSYLEGSIITARFTSPLPNVIRVQYAHFKGRREHLPAFDLDYGLTNGEAEIGQDDQTAWLKAGDLSVVVPTAGEWQIEFRRGDQPLTESEPKALGLFTQGGKTYLREQLSLHVGETTYGLGEQFGALVKNGQAVEMWNEDGGTSSEYAYKNVPFYLTSQGYGVLVNHPGDVSFEVASTHVSRVQFSAEGHNLDYYLFGGATMKESLELYTALSGRPALPPEWSFGLWLSTSFTTNYSEAAVLAAIDQMQTAHIPISVFHFDCFWMKELTWTSLIWDKRYFPDPAGMLQRIRAKIPGIKFCVWINPYIAEASPLFTEGAANGYLLKTASGDVYQVDFWQPGLAFVDFTNPAARAWFASKLRALIDMGIDSFKTDFGERIPADAVYFDGSDPERMHNFYAYRYNQTVFELVEQVKGTGEAVVFARAATAGGQKFPVHWGGDSSSTYPSMAETLRGGLSLGLSGFGFWSHDISGFNDAATPDLYKRWVAFGLLSSHSRLHGNSEAKMPWLFDDEAVDVLRFFNDLKRHLLPYLLDVAREAHDHGWPVLRALVFEFPNDPTCRYLDTEYMLGDALLVAPVFSTTAEVVYYLPAGEWRNLLTGEIAQGGVWRKESHNYFSLPLWVNVERSGAWDCLRGYAPQ